MKRPREASGTEWLAAAGLLALILVLVFAACLWGTIPMSLDTAFGALLGNGDEVIVTIVRDLRLPRALLAVLAGGALAVSGASLQALLQNPLADPFILGVSGGAACGTLAAAAFGDLSPESSVFLAPLAALCGASAAIVLVGLGAYSHGKLDRSRLLLSGIVVNSLASAVILFLLSSAKPASTRGFVFWMLGSLSGATWSSVMSLLVYGILGLFILLFSSRSLDALTLGEETAFTLGIKVERTKKAVYVSASLLAAAAVSQAGIIGFVGLLVPQAVRLLVSHHRAVLVLSFLSGGVLLLGADIFSRWVFSPEEISIGAVTALIGAPAFLLIMRRQA